MVWLIWRASPARTSLHTHYLLEDVLLFAFSQSNEGRERHAQGKKNHWALQATQEWASLSRIWIWLSHHWLLEFSAVKHNQRNTPIALASNLEAADVGDWTEADDFLLCLYLYFTCPWLVLEPDSYVMSLCLGLLGSKTTYQVAICCRGPYDISRTQQKFRVTTATLSALTPTLVSTKRSCGGA